MKDHARSKLLLNDFSQIPQVLELLAQKNIPYETEAIGPTEWGYRGFHVAYRNDSGIGAEIQLSRPDVWKVKLESDKIYDKWRNVDVASMSETQAIERQKAKEKSLKMWHQLDLPGFSIYEVNSSSDNTRANIISSPYNGERSGIQEPSISSSGRNPESSSILPDSVIQAIQTPPSDNIISKQREKDNTFTERMKRYNALIQDHEAIPKGEKPARDISMPKKAADFKTRAENKFLNDLKSDLGFSKYSETETLKKELQKLFDNPDMEQKDINKLFSDITLKALTMGNEFYNNYKGLKEDIRNTALKIDDRGVCF